jgi:Zn-dependent oligopeptidase
MENPFLNKYNTEFEIPPFSKIDESDFMPAFTMGIEGP